MYSSTEIQAAVRKLIRDSIRKPIGALGNRELSVTLTDIQDAAAGVFITDRGAPYYIAYLGSQRLISSVQACISLAEDLLDAITATGRRSTPIESLSSLYNASTALAELSIAASSRPSSFLSVEDVPAYKRFERGTLAFLAETSPNILKGGDIVRTPEEGRVSIPALISSLKELHTAVIKSTRYLGDSLTSYTELNLASSLSSGIVQRARESISGIADRMSSLDMDGRLEILKESTLDILAARAVVKGFGALAAPGIFVDIEGDTEVYTDNTHLATPAVAVADLYGPYPLLGDSNQLDMFLESSTSITLTVQMPGSYIAFIPGALAETYDVPPGFNTFDIAFTGQSPAAVVLGVIPAESAYNSVSNINSACVAAWGSSPYVEAEVYYYPTRWVGDLNIVANEFGVGTHGFTTDIGVNFSNVGVIVGDRVVVRSGTNNRKIYNVVLVALNVLRVTLVSGAATVSTLGTRVEIGVAPGRVRLFIPSPHHAEALASNWAITLPTYSTLGVNSTQALNSIGFFPESVATTRAVPALEVADAVNKSTAVAVGQSTRIVADTQFNASIWSGKGRTKTTTSLQYVIYKQRGYADVSTVGLVTTVTLAGAAEAGVALGDVLVLREAGIPADVDHYGPITLIADTYVEVDFTAVVLPTDVLDVLVEVGPPGYPPNNCILRIADGSVVTGEYRVARSGDPDTLTVPFDLPLMQAIPVTIQNGLPVFSNTAEVGLRRLTFTTEDKTLASRIQITDGFPFYFSGLVPVANPSTALSLLFSGPVDVWGTTKYVSIPKKSKHIELGDKLEVYIANPVTPDSIHTITGLELSSRRIAVSPELPCNQPVVPLVLDQPIPFVRIRKLRGNTFSTLEAGLEVWLDSQANSSIYYQNLYAVINPLLQSSNPTAEQVGTAQSYIQQLISSFQGLQQTLATYTATVVPSVDILVGGMLERGADRAVDILLQGRFQEFFNLSVHTSSYSGSMLESMRAIQREDLAIRKVRRKDAGEQTFTAMWVEQDFEFDVSDMENPVLPAAPRTPRVV